MGFSLVLFSGLIRVCVSLEWRSLRFRELCLGFLGFGVLEGLVCNGVISVLEFWVRATGCLDLLRVEGLGFLTV